MHGWGFKGNIQERLASSVSIGFYCWPVAVTKHFECPLIQRDIQLCLTACHSISTVTIVSLYRRDPSKYLWKCLERTAT